MELARPSALAGSRLATSSPERGCPSKLARARLPEQARLSELAGASSLERARPSEGGRTTRRRRRVGQADRRRVASSSASVSDDKGGGQSRTGDPRVHQLHKFCAIDAPWGHLAHEFVHFTQPEVALVDKDFCAIHEARGQWCSHRTNKKSNF